MTTAATCSLQRPLQALGRRPRRPQLTAATAGWQAPRQGDLAGLGASCQDVERRRDNNRRLLGLQSPPLAAEPAWAHATAAARRGELLLATPATPRQLGCDLHQAVVLLAYHGADGSAGLVLNKPTNDRVGLPGRHEAGVAVPAQGVDDGPANSRTYWGGPNEDRTLLLLHGEPHRRLKGSQELAPGIYLEISRLAVAAVAAGDLAQAMPLRFFSGCCTWGAGELERQVETGLWTTAAASRSLVLKHAVQLPVGLWTELSCMLGSAEACRLP